MPLSDRIMGVFEDNVGLVMLGLLGLITLLVCGGMPLAIHHDNVQRNEDCARICELHGSSADRLTDFGCLCTDGRLFQEQAEDTYVPVVVPVR